MRSLQLTYGGSAARGRWAAIREPVLDATMAGLLWAAMAVDLATRPLTEGQAASAPAAYLWAGAIAGPLAFHRRHPVLAMVVANVAMIGYSLGRYSAFPGYAIFVLVFAVALHSGGRRALVVYAGGVVGLCVSLLLQPPAVATPSSWISTVLTVTVAWLAGENLRSRRARRSHELDEAHREAEQQAEQARRAIGEERLRIARDLHDVVAHSMSVIAVQAGVAHHVVEQRPEVARDALGSIEVAAREALVEMRRLLGVLRTDEQTDAHADTAPIEGLRDLDRLVSQCRSAGLTVEVSESGPVGDLPAALDVTAYRIVQEGLTNVLRHGGPVAYLRVERTPGQLLIQVRDDGRPPGTGPATQGSGHGLTGIRERAALFDGVVVAEPRAGTGFLLRVTLPVGSPVGTR